MNKSDIKSINYHLWMILILNSLIPLIYSTTRIHFLGSIPSSWTFSIAAQVAWLNVGYEVLNEALLLPLAFILGKVIKDEQKFCSQASISLRITILFYALATIFVLLKAPYLVTAMQQNHAVFHSTVQYIRLESIAILVSSIYTFFSLILLLKNEKKTLFTLLIIQMALTIACDSIFVSNLDISLQLNVNGIALSNIITNFTLIAIATSCLSRKGIVIRIFGTTQHDMNWVKEWFAIGWKSGIESLVRNAAFIVMILKMVNQVQQAGTFWIANQFIWGWLLLPVLALGQLVKQDASTNNGLSPSRVKNYLFIILCIILTWVATAPMWEDFISIIMGVDHTKEVANIVWIVIGFYIAFSFNIVIDSYFYGIGRTDLMLYQSLAVNGIFYGISFILYQVGAFVPTLESITVMFGAGIIIDAIVTWFLYYIHRKNT